MEWLREYFQRENLNKGLKMLNDDLILISDLR